MLVLFTGVFEVSQALIVYMKVIDVADTVSDLIAQQSKVQSSDIDNYYIAGKLVMTPSAGAGLGLYVASVTFDPVTGTPSVAWTATRGGATAMTNAAAVAAANGPNGPLGLACPTPNAPNVCDSVILAKASYTYNSALSYLIQLPIKMSAVVLSRPRPVLSISCTSSPTVC
jgi:Flp pilus assembly protein TadG